MALAIGSISAYRLHEPPAPEFNSIPAPRNENFAEFHLMNEPGSKDVRISAVVITHNRAALLTDTLHSLLAQTESVDEIIVVDDGSTDNTRELLKTFGDRVVPVFSKNGGMQNARNLGISHCKFDWIAFCDDDDLWVPERCELIKSLLKSTDVDLVTTDVSIFSTSGIVLPSVFARHRGLYPNIWRHFATIPGTDFSFAHSVPSIELLPESPFWGATLVVSRNRINEIGGWNPAVRGIPSEDLDFVYRALNHRSVGAICRPTVLYRSHDGNVSRNAERKYLGRIDIANLLMEKCHDKVEREHLRNFIDSALRELLWTHSAEGNIPELMDIIRRIGLHRLDIKQLVHVGRAILKRGLTQRPRR